MVVENQEICALTYTNLNKFTRRWSTYLLVPLTLKWVLIGTSGHLTKADISHKEVY